MEDFITITEEILRRERERDDDFYTRERERKLRKFQNKEDTSPGGRTKQPTYRITSAKFNRKILNYSPREMKPRAAFGGRDAGSKDITAYDDIDENFKEAQAILQYITNETNECCTIGERLGSNAIGDSIGSSTGVALHNNRASIASEFTGMFSRTSSPSFDLNDDNLENDSVLFDFDCSNVSDEKCVIDNVQENAHDGIEMSDLATNVDIVDVEINQFGEEEQQVIECFEAPTNELDCMNEGELHRRDSLISIEGGCKDNMTPESMNCRSNSW